jgi:hypothetical protein
VWLTQRQVSKRLADRGWKKSERSCLADMEAGDERSESRTCEAGEHGSGEVKNLVWKRKGQGCKTVKISGKVLERQEGRR